MYFKRSLFTIGFLAFFLSSALAQTPKVKVENPGSRELKRTASRLRISIEQLKNAREALREATELTRRIETTPWGQISILAGLWVELDRSKAAANIESLFADLRNKAYKAADAENYRQLTNAAQGLLSAIANLDADRAMQLTQQWPAPSSSLGDSAQKAHSQLQSQFQLQYLRQLAYRDLERALPLLQQSGEPDYSIRAQMARRMLDSGRREQARKILDQAIGDFGQRNPNPRATQDYANFVQQISTFAPERFPEAFAVLAQPLNKPGPKVDSGVTMRVGDQLAVFTSAEAAVLNVFRGLQGQPELMLRTLHTVPELKAKIDRLGGIDAVFSPRAAPETGMMSLATPSMRPDGSISTTLAPSVARLSMYDRGLPAQLLSELRGLATKNPVLARQKLSEAAGKPEQIEVLISLSQMANYADPDLSALVLELAGSLLPQLQPLERRAGALQNLIRAWRQCEGEVDPVLIREGFILADQLREEERKKIQDNPNRKSGSIGFADNLEVFLLGEYARDNFDAAVRYVRSIPEADLRLRALAQIAQSLRRNY